MITEKQFFDRMLDKYETTTGDDLPADDLGYYLEYFLNSYPNEKLELPITKKVAARLIHEFMLNVLEIPDEDWGEAAGLKDIYDCRVCSNAIAQVYNRGIILAHGDGVFGLSETLSEEDAGEILDRFAKMICKL